MPRGTHAPLSPLQLEGHSGWVAYDSVLFSFLTWPPARRGFQAQGLQRVSDTTEQGGEQAGEEPSLSSLEMATPSPQLRSQARGPPLAFSHTNSNPLANTFGSAFSSHPPSDVSHYFHGSHPSPGQHYHSPGLSVTSSLVALMSPSSLTVYTGARVAISGFHFNGLI